MRFGYNEVRGLVLRFFETFFRGERKVKLRLGGGRVRWILRISELFFFQKYFLELFFRIHAGHVVVVVIVIVIVNKIHVGSSKILLLEGGFHGGFLVVFVIRVVLVMFGGSADGHFFGIGRPLFGLG